MKSLLKFSFLLSLTAGLVFSGCRRDQNELDNDITSTQDNTSAEYNFDQIFNQVDDAALNGGLKKGYPIITIDTTNTPRNMIIDFGPDNFLCQDGNYRRGKILVNWTGKYKNEGTIINIGFDGFYQNDNHVEGAKSIINNGRNSSQNLTWTIIVNGKITNVSNEVIVWQSNRTREWIQGEQTQTHLDDVYLVSGTASGTNRRNKEYTAVITTPLRVDLSCQWRIVSGVVEIKPTDKPLRVLDFGTGACDKIVSVTVNGKTYTFERRK